MVVLRIYLQGFMDRNRVIGERRRLWKILSILMSGRSSASSNAIREQTLAALTFSGSYAYYDVTHWGEESTAYKPVTVKLDGLTVTPRLQMRPTGIRVLLECAEPPDWRSGAESCNLCGGCGLVYELYVDGVSAGQPFIESSGAKLWMDIPMTASERQDCASLVLKPLLLTWRAFIVDGVEYPLSEGEPIPRRGFEPVFETCPVAGGDIVIPLKLA